MIILATDEPSEENDLTCVTCLVNKRQYAVEPCNHLSMCGRCTDVHRKGRDTSVFVVCPMCRKVVKGYHRVLY